MLFCEYDWTSMVYRFRFGFTFIDVDGFRSAATLDEVKSILSRVKLKLGDKTDTRTWKVAA